jgi:hypothetical protein
MTDFVIKIPNLSRPFVRLRSIGFGVSGVSGLRAAANVSRPAAREREHSVMKTLCDSARHQQHRADTAREQLARLTDLFSKAVPRCHSRARGQGHCPIEQRGQIVRRHLGDHIHQQGMLAQPADTLQHQPVLDPLECLRDAPAPVVEIGQLRHRGNILRQRRRQHLAAGFGQVAVRDQNGCSTGVQAGKECVEFV